MDRKSRKSKPPPSRKEREKGGAPAFRHKIKIPLWQNRPEMGHPRLIRSTGSSFAPESFAQIFVAGVAEDRDDDCFLVFLQGKLAADLKASHNSGRGRNSYQQSRVSRKLASHGVGVLGRDLQIGVRNAGVINLGDDRACHMLGAFDAVE